VQSTKQLTSVGTESTCIEMAGGDGQQQTAFNRRMAKLVNSRLRIVDDSPKKKRRSAVRNWWIGLVRNLMVWRNILAKMAVA
jgi:hypothetical protein